MEEVSKKSVVNHFETGSNCQVFNGNITGCVFAMPGSTVNQQPTVKDDEELKTMDERLDLDDKEELFHFIHPEIEDVEAWHIHVAMKRLVVHQKVNEICTYLKELKKMGKVMLPSSPATMYKELKRMGMPTGEGYTEKHFKNCYLK